MRHYDDMVTLVLFRRVCVCVNQLVLSSCISMSSLRPANQRLYADIWHSIGDFLGVHELAIASRIDRSWNWYLSTRRPSTRLVMTIGSNRQYNDILTSNDDIRKHVVGITIGSSSEKIRLSFPEITRLGELFANLKYLRIHVHITDGFNIYDRWTIMPLLRGFNFVLSNITSIDPKLLDRMVIHGNRGSLAFRRDLFPALEFSHISRPYERAVSRKLTNNDEDDEECLFDFESRPMLLRQRAPM